MTNPNLITTALLVSASVLGCSDPVPSGDTQASSTGGVVEDDTASETGTVGTASSGESSSGAGSDDGESSSSTGGPTPLLPGIHVLDGVEQDLPHDDLAPVDLVVRDARIVGLGESSHTVDGFLAGKARISRYLIEERGFRVVGLETPWTDMRAMEAHLETCRTDGVAVTASSMFAVWADLNMVEFVAWLCAWNGEHPDDPVTFIGWDHQQPWHDGAIVQAAMEAVDPASLETLFTDVDACNGVGFTSFEEYVDSAEAAVWSGSPPDAAAHAQCTAALPQLEAWRTAHEAAFAPDQRFDLQLAVRGIEAWEDSAFYAPSDARRSFESRDHANAETILQLAQQRYPEQRIVLWAHNAHLFRDTPSLGGGLHLAGASMLGTQLAGALGDDYVVIGMTGYDIDITWFTPYDVEPADGANAIERHLDGLGEDVLFVNVSPWDDSSFRAGVAYDFGHPIQGIESLVPREQMDAFVFVRESPGMTPVEG